MNVRKQQLLCVKGLQRACIITDSQLRTDVGKKVDTRMTPLNIQSSYLAPLRVGAVKPTLGLFR
jgi:hypothetical protein